MSFDFITDRAKIFFDMNQQSETDKQEHIEMLADHVKRGGMICTDSTMEPNKTLSHSDFKEYFNLWVDLESIADTMTECYTDEEGEHDVQLMENILFTVSSYAVEFIKSETIYPEDWRVCE